MSHCNLQILRMFSGIAGIPGCTNPLGFATEPARTRFQPIAIIWRRYHRVDPSFRSYNPTSLLLSIRIVHTELGVLVSRDTRNKKRLANGISIGRLFPRSNLNPLPPLLFRFVSNTMPDLLAKVSIGKVREKLLNKFSSDLSNVFYPIFQTRMPPAIKIVKPFSLSLFFYHPPLTRYTVITISAVSAGKEEQLKYDNR